MNAIQEFCKQRKITPAIEIAFTAYVKAIYSSSLAVRPGDTLNKIVGNLTATQVEEQWLKFVYDFKETLPPSST